MDALPVLIIFPDFNEIFIRNRIFSHAHRHAGSFWPVRGPQVLLTAHVMESCADPLIGAT